MKYQYSYETILPPSNVAMFLHKIGKIKRPIPVWIKKIYVIDLSGERKQQWIDDMNTMVKWANGIDATPKWWGKPPKKWVIERGTQLIAAAKVSRYLSSRRYFYNAKMADVSWMY